MRPERFELRQLALESWTPYSDAAAERGVLLEISIDPGLQITSDRQLLGRVLQNLLEDLGNYADEGTMARLAATSRGDQVAVIVENDCAGLDEELVRHAFDAWRSDDARSAVGRHAGLGLALCQQLVELLSGTISASGDSGRFCVTIVLPRDSFTAPSLGASEGPQGSRDNDPSAG